MDHRVGAANVKRVLMIAYHFPPVQGSSGVQRTLKFCRYLPNYGWEPMVLTVDELAYPATDAGQIAEIPHGMVLKRTFALDTARHLAIRGRYPYWLALPDRWASWCVSAVIAGLRLIREYRPTVLWSTYPIATAHAVGLMLHRLSRLPWVADLRDSMTEDSYPNDPRIWRAFRWIEKQTVERANRVAFTTPGALCMYRERYASLPPERWTLIANGYDEESFRAAERAGSGPSPRSGNRLVLVHSGVLYRSERDPSAFFAAIADLVRSEKISPERLEIVLRASGDEAYYQKILDHQGIAEMVKLKPALPYRAALEEMLRADGLLLFQAASCNHQIPAKLYEYLRTQRPVLALTDPAGDTACALRKAGAGRVVRIDSKEEIRDALLVFLREIGTLGDKVAVHDVQQYSREARTRELAQLFDTIAEGG
ncbi:MAG: glycosyltransferase [Gammaproteobacteria bacterium]